MRRGSNRTGASLALFIGMVLVIFLVGATQIGAIEAGSLADPTVTVTPAPVPVDVAADAISDGPLAHTACVTGDDVPLHVGLTKGDGTILSPEEAEALSLHSGAPLEYGLTSGCGDVVPSQHTGEDPA